MLAVFARPCASSTGSSSAPALLVAIAATAQCRWRVGVQFGIVGVGPAGFLRDRGEADGSEPEVLPNDGEGGAGVERMLEGPTPRAAGDNEAVVGGVPPVVSRPFLASAPEKPARPDPSRDPSRGGSPYPGAGEFPSRHQPRGEAPLKDFCLWRSNRNERAVRVENGGGRPAGTSPASSVIGERREGCGEEDTGRQRLVGRWFGPVG